jgi:hypothetical protein
MELIAVAVAGVVLLIVIIAAISKRRNLNRHSYIDPDELERFADEFIEETDANSVEASSQTSQERGRVKRRKNNSSSQDRTSNAYSSLLYYVYLDDNTYGPFSLEQLKTYPLLEDTLITTNTLNGSWFEAKYFECLDELFRPNLPFRIDADGVILRSE